MMPIFLPETMHINIQSQSQLYTQAYATFLDTHGVQQHVMVVSEKRNMIRTMPTVTKLYDRSGALTGKPGDLLTIQLDMQRTSNMLNAMNVKVLSDNEHIQNMLTGIEFKKGQRNLEIPIKLPAEIQPGTYQLTLEATGPLDSKPNHIVVTSVQMEIVVQDTD